ncbi:2666_t:CDS:2, partial [Paraglomus brasilianum]
MGGRYGLGRFFRDEVSERIGSRFTHGPFERTGNSTENEYRWWPQVPESFNFSEPSQGLLCVYLEGEEEHCGLKYTRKYASSSVHHFVYLKGLTTPCGCASSDSIAEGMLRVCPKWEVCHGLDQLDPIMPCDVRSKQNLLTNRNLDEIREIAAQERIQEKKINHEKKTIEYVAVVATADASRKHFLAQSTEANKRLKTTSCDSANEVSEQGDPKDTTELSGAGDCEDNYDQDALERMNEQDALEQMNEQDFEIVLKINDKCIRSIMNEWHEKAKYIPSIHKQ